MTTAFQYVFNNAESISINKRRMVGTTTTRDNTVRSVNRFGQTWRFEVKLPDGISWTSARPEIERMEALDRTTVATVQINNAGYNTWLTPYQGNATGTIAATWTQGANAISITSGSATSGFNFRAGDLIQLGSSGRVYSVPNDVAFNVTTVPVNRPIIDNSGSGNLVCGTAVTWSVLCVEFPSWTIFSRDQVSWSGPFVFYENMV
jgi:hypothetical protein